MSELLDGARVFLCLAFLTYASWSDLKKREVSNMVWVAFAPSALALTFLQYFLFAPQSLFTYVLSFAATSALSIVLFYAGAFGGADAKALICISLALPSYPTYLLQPACGVVSPLSSLLFPLTAFCNAILFAALSVFYALIRNCLWKLKTKKGFWEGFEKEPRWRRMLTLLCGYKVRIEELRKMEHSYPLEDIRMVEAGEIERKLLVMPKDEERGEIVERILGAASQGKLQNDVWVTPGLPLLVFITTGLVVGLLLGDIVWIILRSALG